MKKIQKISYSLIIALLFLAIVSCGTETSREDKVSTIISQIENPMAIMNVKPGAIIEKSGVLDGVLPYTQGMLLDFFINDTVTGVDYDKDMQVVVGGGTTFLPGFYGIGILKDEQLFIDLLTAEANAKIVEVDGFKYVIKESDMYVIVWNEEFVIASNIPMSLNSVMGSSGAKEGKKAVDKLIAQIKAADEEPNTTYSEFLKNDADLGVHVIGGGVYSYLSGMAMGDESEIAQSKELLEGSNGEIFIKFNDGDIVIQILADMTEELMGQVNMWNDKAVDSKVLKFGNSKNPMFTMGHSFNIEKFIAEAESESPLFNVADIEKQLDKMGLTLNDANAALDGDVVFILDRIDIKEEVIDWGYGEPYIMYNPNPIFSIAAGIKDESIVQKIFSDFDSISAGMYRNGEAYLACANKVLFSSNDSAWVSDFLLGTTVQVEDRENVFTDKPFGLFLDFAQVAMMEDMKDGKVLIDLMNYAKGIGDVNEMNLSFVFKDNSRNALRILTEAISSMTEERPQTQEAMEIQNELEEAAQ